jgi:hypothetical protein
VGRGSRDEVVCSWCEGEGKPALVREKEPLDDSEETHGVCPEHKVLLGSDGKLTSQKMDGKP